MIEFVESTVLQFSKELSPKLNKGDRLRIMKDGWYGSMWVTYKKRTDKYRFLLTGNVDTKIASKIALLYGKYNLETRDYKYWDLNKADVKKIIRLYAHTV
jgi:hypothetical protein